MIDTSLLPDPEGMPEPGTCVRIERPEPGLCVVVLDPPHRKLAVFDKPLVRDLDAAIDELELEIGLRGVILTGKTPTSFAAGADLDGIAGVVNRAFAEQLSKLGQDLFARIAKLDAHTVAAVGGPVPGGAYEICLHCDTIVVADDPSTKIGLPETKLGILPGWGGSQRLPRRVGIVAALGAILNGSLVPAKVAKKRGMVDRVTPPESLLHVATEIAMGRESVRRPSRRLATWLVDKNPAAAALIARKARKELQAKTHGHYPAPEMALELVCKAPRTPLKIGLAAEAEALGKLAVSPVCKNLVSLFRMSEDAKRSDRLASGERAEGFRRVAVLGGGVMGGGIASHTAFKGMQARLLDLDRKAVDAAGSRHRGAMDKLRKRRRLLPHQAEAAKDRLELSTEPVGFGNCDLLIEAIVERLDVKRAVLSEWAERLPRDAVLATNTSSLSVTEIAAELPAPERVVGIHFFNPVDKMPLVEIVPGEKTSEEVVARAARYALDLGKTPVVVKDVAGFVVNRLLGPYLDEAGRLISDGVPCGHLEHLALHFGMPMGPLELLDEVGFDVAAHAGASLHRAYGPRFEPHDLLQRMLDAGYQGKKNGRGFYTGSKGHKHLSEDLAPFLPQGAHAHIDDAEAVDRMVLAMVNEAARCVEEEVTRSVLDLDLATVFGMGFAPFRGGLLRYADSRGAGNIVQRLEELLEEPRIAERPGARERFEPAPLLRELAASGRGFHDLDGKD